MKEYRVQTAGSSEKLESYKAVMEWDDAAQFRAIVYARLMRAMVDAFGEEVLDVAEDIRRESGRYCGEMQADIAGNESRYEEDPGNLIRDMDAMWHGLSPDWGRTCVCDFNAVPEKTPA